MKNNLSKKGLSMSQAQSVSNLIYQKSLEIKSKLEGVNNAEKKFSHNGETYISQAKKVMPEDVVELIQEKARLHASQGFLVHNIKEKSSLLDAVKRRPFITTIKEPVKPELNTADLENLKNEEWGWNQLTASEFNEFLEREAYAAHIGQFIHKDGILTKLREELPTIKQVEFIDVKKDEKTPVKIEIHHTAETLMGYHEKLAALHREHEARVNYTKAKVHNMITEKNAQISHDNAVKQAEVAKQNSAIIEQYRLDMQTYADAIKKAKEEFEAARQKETQETAALRIEVDARFQPVIDEFLKGLPEEKEGE